MYGRDPSSAPRLPRNPRGMWKCSHCGEWNDPENDPCFACDETDPRPQPTTEEN